ncbi:MAG: pterin-4-alpha-carbinolamine dehydratase [Homoserinimonas sp.]|jgi:4a-hydroxytetrahydrobiopterin dehydratase|nr:pterin-4-alpha-carbinolamine dehydratase [Homoserinimonas sp.]
MDTDQYVLSADQTRDDLEGTSFQHRDNALAASYTFPDFATAARLVALASDLAQSLGHHPDICFGWGKASFAVSSHDVGGVTGRDVTLAKAIQDLADEVGAQ